MDKYTKRDSTGAVDVSASAVAYADALTNWITENEADSETIETAVNTVLDRHPLSRIPMPALLGYVAHEMGSSPETFATVSNRVHAYIKGQTEAGKLFVVRGKNGGVAKFAPTPKADKAHKTA